MVLIDNVPISTMAFQSSSNVTITGGTITGIVVPTGSMTFAYLSSNGNSQNTATVLTANVNIINQVVANTGVIITAPAGTIQYVAHRGNTTNTLNIFPPISASIEQQGINSPFPMGNNYSIGFFVCNSTQIIALVGGPSNFAF